MIREIICTGDKFEGQILLSYDADNELLVGMDLTSAMISKEQHKWFLNNLPISITRVNILGEAYKTMHFTDKEVTFDMFWQRYADKERSSKKKTEAKWNKMTKAERLKAYNYIPKYSQSIPYGTCKKYATTYLNDELWNN